MDSGTGFRGHINGSSWQQEQYPGISGTAG